MECTLQQDTLQEKRKALLINFQRLSIYRIFFILHDLSDSKNLSHHKTKHNSSQKTSIK